MSTTDSSSLLTPRSSYRSAWSGPHGDSASFDSEEEIALSTEEILAMRSSVWSGPHGDFNEEIAPWTLETLATRPNSSYRTTWSGPQGDSTIPEHELASSTEEILATCPKHVSHSSSRKKQNPLFILHDSQGFEAGETQNFDTVKKFIDDRAQQPELKDRLHAIWFCIEIPTENGALIETADQKFLELDLRNVPVIVVFTKYDLLISKLEKMATDDVDDEELEELVRHRAEVSFHETCVRPLMAITKAHSYLKVSTKKYWRGLATSLHFPGKSLKQCLDRIHDDIIDVWNFNDPKMLLKSQDFRILLADRVKDLDDRSIHRTGEIVTTVSSVIGGVASIIPGAVVFVIPAAAGVAIAQWLFCAYKEAPRILQLLMGYICDLTTVLQCLFWVMRIRGDALEVGSHLIELALKEYDEAGAQQFVHGKIRTFVDNTATFKLLQKDAALEELIGIVGRIRFKPEEVGNSPRRALFMTFPSNSILSTLSRGTY
ncbi:hypothetical protein GYMLUDRAFT_248048 [Collybiopsis luxurians FD-317 M1]|uniref:G domain-containing protein n=1 Tax=Collybiopsis luxurians FD-317 M1 TaxID=944289 RepID=A0A0D0CM88_9AGAR|nr:hypothetical protein GYMLUDRAFT_248048 [Collybiopsis luxurians FD-317 M1]